MCFWTFSLTGREGSDCQRNLTLHLQIAAVHWDSVCVTVTVGDVCGDVRWYHSVMSVGWVWIEAEKPGRPQTDPLSVAQACGGHMAACLSAASRCDCFVTKDDLHMCVHLDCLCSLMRGPHNTHMLTCIQYTVCSAKLGQAGTECKALWRVWERGTVTEWQPQSPVSMYGSVTVLLREQRFGNKEKPPSVKGLLAQLWAFGIGCHMKTTIRKMVVGLNTICYEM